MKGQLELWKLNGRGDVDIQRLQDVDTVEEAVVQAMSNGKGRYNICDPQGNVMIVKVLRVPVLKVVATVALPILKASAN